MWNCVLPAPRPPGGDRISDEPATQTAPRAQSEAPATEELITVVVPAKDEEDAIVACLDSIRAQDWSNLQIVVIDGDSSDATPQLVEAVGRQDPRVELLHNPRGIIPVSMNIGLEGHVGATWYGSMHTRKFRLAMFVALPGICRRGDGEAWVDGRSVSGAPRPAAPSRPRWSPRSV